MDIVFPNSSITNLEELSGWIKDQKEAVTVTFLKGNYYGTLTLDSLLCPSAAFIAPDGAVIAGGRETECEFKRTSQNIFEARIQKNLIFERLLINGQPKILARYPKYIEGERLNGSASLEEIEKVTADFNVEGAFLHSLHRHEWGGNDYKVTGRKDNHFALSWVGNNNRGSEMYHKCCYIENIPRLLTAENEWYYDKNSGALRIFDNSGEQSFKAKVSLCDKINLVTVKNCKNTQITFKGFTFANTDRSLFRLPWSRYLRSDWAFNYGSTVRIRDSENVTVKDCSFENLGSNCIGIFDYNENIVIDNCDFRNSLTNGVLILGSPESTYCNSSWEGEHHVTEFENGGKTGAASDAYPRNILIDNCCFYNLGTEDKQSAGVCISLSHKVTVSRSTLHHLPRAGINICENAFGGHIIKDCDLFDCVRETGDHGPFNSWGRDRFWSLGGFDTSGKKGEIKKEFALCDMLDPNRIIHNRVVGNGGFGIDLDDGSCNYIIENNFCFGVGIKLREGFFRTVRNNVIVNAPLDLHATYAGNDDIVEANAVLNKQPIRIALLNKGFTTKINGNCFMNAESKAKRQRIFKGTKNYFTVANADDILNNNFTFDGFKSFDYSFGREDAPKPELDLLNKLEKNQGRIVNKYGVFLPLDDSLRSATGAPDLKGFYVEKLFTFTHLKRRGLKKSDVILAVNGKAFTASKQEFKDIINCKTEVIRQQKHIEL